MIRIALALIAYAAAVAAANIMTARYGLWPVAPGLETLAGTYAAGLALGARDILQEAGGRPWVIAGLALGAVASGVTAGWQLAFASSLAFLISEMADWGVYSKLRERSRVQAVLTSNGAGAVVDTLAFGLLAGFPITFAMVGGQLAGKVVWATAVPVLLYLAYRQVRRVVSGQPQHAEGA